MAEKVRIQSGRQRRLSQLEEQAGKVAPSGIYIAQVREVKDTNKMGIIRVHVEGTQRPDVPAEWATVQYASPFAGAISQDEAEGKSVIFDADANDYSQVFTSYGMWFPQVKINNKVLVFFAENDFEKGYYFANCLPDYQNSTLPGLASSKKKSGSSLAVTAAAIAAAQGLGGASGSSNGHVVGSERGIVMPGQVQPGVEGDTSGAERVEHPLTDALKAQGLDKDHIRGHSSSSARRDLTSKCFGILTPGQHQFVMDDDADQPLIRLRTSNGSQILINDAGDGVIYFITKKGKSWLEMHGDGTIDVSISGSGGGGIGTAINYSDGTATPFSYIDPEVTVGEDLMLDDTSAGTSDTYVVSIIPQINIASGIAVTVGSGKTMIIDVLQIGDL